MSEVKTQNKIRVCDVKRAACCLEIIYLLDESKVEGYEFTSHGIYWNLIIGMPFFEARILHLYVHLQYHKFKMEDILK